MLMLLDSLVIAGSATLAGYAIVATVGPNLTRIREAIVGESQRFAPLEALVLAERRIAVRRWAASPRAAAVRLREAA